MVVRRWQSAFTVALIGAFVMVFFLSGTAFAQKKEADMEGWLGVYIQEVDEDLAEAWDLDSEDGVIVDDVVDDSPAEEAGLEPGDVIVTYDGRTVTTSGRLTRWIRRTEPDTKVTLEIIRGGARRAMEVVIGESDPDYYSRRHRGDRWSFRTPSIHVPRIEVFGDDDDIYLAKLGKVRIGVSLYELNPQLADYFGVEAGVLIDEVIEDSPAEAAGLKAGDVIVEIDGHDIEEPVDVVDEIADYEEGDTIEIVVVRDKSRQTFAVEVEEDGYATNRYHLRKPRIAKPNIVRVPHFRQWDKYEEFQEDLEEAMEELREELEELREDLEEELEEIRRGR